MKIDERCLPYAEKMKTFGYCAEGEYRAVLAAYGLKADTPEPEIVARLFKLYAEMTENA